MDVFAVIRYDSRCEPPRKEDLVGVFSTIGKAKAYIWANEETTEGDFDIEQHTVDDPEASAP